MELKNRFDEFAAMMVFIVVLILAAILWIFIIVIPTSNNPNVETNVQCYKIVTSEFHGKEAIYAKEYQQVGNGIHLSTWWKYNGAYIWNTEKHIGDLYISGDYSIETVTVSSLTE